MERRRRRQRPLECGRAGTPRIVPCPLLADEGLEDAEEEDQRAQSRDVGADRRDEVPAGERVGVIGDAARHPREPEEVLREEDDVDADEGDPKVQLADRLRVHVAAHLGEPVVPAREDGEDGAERQHVVEVRDHVVGVLQRPVDAGIGEHDAGHAADGEQEDEPDRPQHRRLELDRPAPHGRDPREDLHAGRHRDHHGGGGEIHLHGDRHAGGEHVVRPHDEPDAADRHHGVGHAEIAEHGLLRERRDDLADDAEARHDQDVHLGMAEEPEQVLEQDRVATAVGREEGRAEVTVGEQHGDGTGKHRQREQQQEHGYQLRPHEQRHLVQRHAGRAHIEDRGDEVDRAQDRRGARDVQRQDGEVDRRTGMARGR